MKNEELIRRQDVIDALELSLENDYVDATDYDWKASPEDPMKAPLVSLDDTNFGTTWNAYRKERE